MIRFLIENVEQPWEQYILRAIYKQDDEDDKAHDSFLGGVAFGYRCATNHYVRNRPPEDCKLE